MVTQKPKEKGNIFPVAGQVLRYEIVQFGKIATILYIFWQEKLADL